MAQTLSAPALPVKFRGLLTVSLMAATTMQVLDTTIANVALPHMQGSLSAAQDQIAWVLTSYIVAAAIATPLTGWFASKFGRKELILVSVAGFTIASMLCGLATSLTEIVAFRFLQGVFGASLVPLAQSIMLDINPRERVGQAMAIWGAGIMVAPIMGPTLGGWLTENYDWRWVFYINVPIGIFAFIGTIFFMPGGEGGRHRPFDFLGFAMLSIAVGALQLVLDRGELKDWFGSMEIIIEMAVTVCGFWMFGVYITMAKHPFLDPKMLKDRNFVAGLLFMVVLGITLYATMALLPPLLQGLMQYSAYSAGLVMMPRGVGTLSAMLIVGRLSGKVDPRLMLCFGFCVVGIALWEMVGFSVTMDQRPIIISSIVQGFGLGFIFPPLTTISFVTLAPALRNEATAFFSLVRNIGGSIGISLAETIFTEEAQVNHADLATHVTPYEQAFKSPILGRIWNLHSSQGLSAINAEVSRQAAMIGYIDVFKLMLIMTLGCLPLLLFLSKGSGAPAGGPGQAAHAME